MNSVFLSLLDKWLHNFLISNCDSMPSRFVKLIAFYYTDAQIRKIYLNRLGIKMGHDSFTNLGLILLSDGDYKKVHVDIGSNVTIAGGVTFISDASAVNGVEINTYFYVKDKITCSGTIIIEDEVWLGAGCIIMPGVRIARCSVIGAGSVVLSDVDAYSIYAGVPARKIRDIRTGKRVNK